MSKPSAVVCVLCSNTRVVAILVWYLNLAEAVGAPVHGHQALRGTGEWELLVEVPHLSLPCDRICFFGPDVAVGLPFGYRNAWS